VGEVVFLFIYLFSPLFIHIPLLLHTSLLAKYISLSYKQIEIHTSPCNQIF